MDFLRERFRALTMEGPVIGVGIDPPVHVPTSEFCTRYGLDDPFLLYVGRVDAAKGCASLFDDLDARARKGD